MERLVVITGLSGSGKSLAVNCLEDLGFFCVDNLPVSLILPFCELLERGGERLARAAIVVDARERPFLGKFPEILAKLRERELPVQVVFFECSDDVLKRRFSETRRPHPMATPKGTLEGALQSEREELAPLREVADRIVDTTRFTSHELRAFLKSTYSAAGEGDVPSIHVLSFGFKYGVPAEVDLVFDVRFLPNPYFVDGLRHLDGRSEPVRSYIEKTAELEPFLEHLYSLLDFLVPQYSKEGKAYLVIGMGCTGGKHRSVALTERLAKHFTDRGWASTASHRDLGKE